jgi:hypothetical protein
MVSPAPQAWAYFIEHHTAIRSVVAAFLPRTRMEIPNTRVTYTTGTPVRNKDTGAEIRDSVFLPIDYSVEDFDKAVAAVDVVILDSIMNSAFLRAPEDRDVYLIPGFIQICNLIDETVPGFLGGEDATHD